MHKYDKEWITERHFWLYRIQIVFMTEPEGHCCLYFQHKEETHLCVTDLYPLPPMFSSHSIFWSSQVPITALSAPAAQQ